MKETEHRPAVALANASRWWKELAQREGMGARALQFLTLTAARSGEVRGMTWGEVEFEPAPGATRAVRAIPKGAWVIPAPRMKDRREHRVPLPADAVEILRKAAGAD